MAAGPRHPVAGRTVLITGAARGLGAEAARHLHARGARVALVGLEPALLKQRAAELGGRDAAAFEADVTDAAALDAAVAGTVERFGGIDVVIANAGVAPVGTVSTMDPAAFEATIAVNLLGVWRTVRAALPHVVQRRGYVLPVASLAAAVHAPMMAAYCASKAGTEAFADALRLELAHTGTAVGCAYFSFIDTDMVRDALSHPASQRAQAGTRGPFGSVTPLPEAGRVIADGVERRARKVYAPRWVGAMLALRGVLGPVLERDARRPEMVEAIRMAEADPRGPGSGPLAPS